MVKEGASVTAGESVMRIPMVISPPSCVNALCLSLPHYLRSLICFCYSIRYCYKCFHSGGLHVNQDCLFFIVKYSSQGSGSVRSLVYYHDTVLALDCL